MNITTILGDDTPLALPDICKALGPEGKPLTPRTVSRYMNEPDGLAWFEMGGRKYSTVSSLRDFIKRREHRPNPRRQSRKVRSRDTTAVAAG